MKDELHDKKKTIDFLFYLIRKNYMKQIRATLLKGETTLDGRKFHE